jgi:hypothetical protein
LTAVFIWHSRFKAGQVSVEDDERSGWPSTSKMTENVEKIRELIHEDHCCTIHEFAHTIGISYGTCQEILTEILTRATLPRSMFPDSSQMTTWLSFSFLPTHQT